MSVSPVRSGEGIARLWVFRTESKTCRKDAGIGTGFFGTHGARRKLPLALWLFLWFRGHSSE